MSHGRAYDRGDRWDWSERVDGEWTKRHGIIIDISVYADNSTSIVVRDDDGKLHSLMVSGPGGDAC